MEEYFRRVRNEREGRALDDPSEFLSPPRQQADALANLPPVRVIRQQVQSGALLRSILGAAAAAAPPPAPTLAPVEASSSGLTANPVPAENTAQMDVDDDGDVRLDDVRWIQESPPPSPYSA